MSVRKSLKGCVVVRRAHPGCRVEREREPSNFPSCGRLRRLPRRICFRPSRTRVERAKAFRFFSFPVWSIANVVRCELAYRMLLVSKEN